MSLSRRDVLEAALTASVAAATPQSLFAMQGRAVPPDARFVVVALKDGRRLAVDRVDGKKAYVLSTTPVRDGEYPLSKAGSLVVEGGNLRDVRGQAESAEYSFVKNAGTIEVRNRKGVVVSRSPAAREPQR